MKTGHYFSLFIYVLIFSHIIHADLFEDLLGVSDNSGSNGNSAAPVSPSSTAPTSSSPPPPPPVNHSSSKPNTSPDTKEDPNPSPPPLQSHKIPPPPVQSSSPPKPLDPPPHTPSSDPTLNNPPSSPPSSTPPASSNIDNASASVETPPSSQPSKNSPHSTTGSSSTSSSTDTPNKSHSSGNGNTAPSKSNNNPKPKNSNSHENNDTTSSSSSVGITSPSTTMVSDDASPSSDVSQKNGSGTFAIAGAVAGCVVGLALIGAIMLWCRKRGSAKRQKGLSDDSFKPAEDYSISMRSPGMVNMDIPAPFDYSRRLVAGANHPPAPPSPMTNTSVPVYTDDYHHHQQQEYEQEYHHQAQQQQISPHDYHQQPLQQQEYQQQYIHAMPPQDLTAEGTNNNYFYQPEIPKWDYDQHQLQNNYDNYNTMDSSGAGVGGMDPYYHDQQHAYKPNAI